MYIGLKNITLKKNTGNIVPFECIVVKIKHKDPTKVSSWQ